MAGNGGMSVMAPALTRANVKALTDISEAMTLMDEYEIPYDGLKTLEELQERCICHLKKMACGSVRDNIEDSMIKAGEDDKAKRHTLLCFLGDIENILTSAGYTGYPTEERPVHTLAKLLKEDGTSGHLAKDIQSRKENLEVGDCRILVSGETNAGKSSCLNLVFRENDLLKEAPVSSTSVITSIRYNEIFSARVYHQDGTEEDINRQKLNDILFMKDRRKHDISEVQIRLNSKILQNTMVLMDSPGIGENEFLEDLLINYVNNHEIRGFIYVIKTDNAGGVQEDRLLNLLRIVMKQQSDKQNGKITSRFDPRAAIFLCNRFDNVKEPERNKVKKHVLNQLGKIWPSLSESQVIFLSCFNAKRDLQVDSDYVSDGYQGYLEGLRNLYFYAMERRILDNYNWIETILERSLYHLKTIDKRLHLSKRDLGIKLQETQEKLKRLKTKSDSVISELKDDLERLTQDICKELQVYLDTPMVRTRLVAAWTENDLPKADDDSWAYIKAKVEEAFYVRLGHLLNEWNHDNKKIKEHEKEMIIKIQDQLNLLQPDIERIEDKIEGDCDSGLGRSRGSKRTSVRDVFKRFTSTDPTCPDNMADNPSLRMILTRPIKQKFVKDYVDKYRKHPVKYAQHRSRKLLSWLLERKTKGKMELLTLVKNLLARPYKYIEILERSVPTFIRATYMEIQRVQTCQEKERQQKMEFLELKSSFEQLKSSVREYGEGYIFVDDFSRDELKVEELMKDKQNPQGLWTIYQDGFLCKSEERKPVTIRVYLPSSGMANTLHEMAKLRNLNVENTYLAEFLGMHHTDTPTPAIVYEGRYLSLRRYLNFLSTGHDMGGSINDQRMAILLKVAIALDYLETKNMVHMELTKDTITVTDTGEVRLTGACLPRIATFPSQMEHISVGNFCYLAPEVLKGESYTSAADIYSFGLLFPEVLLTKFSAFEKQRTWTMDEFVKHQNPALIVLDELTNFPIDLGLIKACLKKDKTHRPRAMQITEQYFHNVNFED